MIRFSATLLLTTGFLLVSSLSGADEADGASPLDAYRPLLDDSPFLSLAFKDRLAKSGAGGADKIVFLGYAKIDDEWRLCLAQDSSSPPVWLSTGDELAGFTVAAFQPTKKIVVLEKGGIQAERPLEMPK